MNDCGTMVMGRKNWIDDSKGLLIALVVAGHVLGMGAQVYSGSIAFGCSALYKLIYVFHMPAFFMLAGWTWRLDVGEFRAFVAKKIHRLLIPYFTFGVASAIFFLCYKYAIGGLSGSSHYAGKAMEAWWVPFLGLLHGGGWPNGQGFVANNVLWFLPCLFMVELTAYALSAFSFRHDAGKLRVSVIWFAVVLVSFVAALSMRHNDFRLPWGLSRLPFFLQYFSLGVIGRSLISELKYTRSARFALGAIHMTCVIVFSLLSPDQGMAVFSVPWYSGYAIVGAMGSIGIVLVSSTIHCRLLSLLGRQSLGVMLVHKIFQLGITAMVGTSILPPYLYLALLFVSTIGVSLLLTCFLDRHAAFIFGRFTRD